jgi:serine O-acetyltransferase
MLDALTLQRAAHLLHSRHVPVLPRLLKRLVLHLYGSVLDPALDLPATTRLGYGGIRIVVHPGARIGERVLISHGVTIGGRAGHAGLPIVEDDVRIGAGAVILGPVRVGRGALVGANAVVLHDVRPRAVVGGVPARELPAPRAAALAAGLAAASAETKG